MFTIINKITSFIKTWKFSPNNVSLYKLVCVPTHELQRMIDKHLLARDILSTSDHPQLFSSPGFGLFSCIVVCGGIWLHSWMRDSTTLPRDMAFVVLMRLEKSSPLWVQTQNPNFKMLSKCILDSLLRYPHCPSSRPTLSLRGMLENSS